MGPSSVLTTRQFLAKLRQHDIKLWLEGDELHCDAPAEAISGDLRDELARRKGPIIELLTRGLDTRSTVVPVQPRGTRPWLWVVPGAEGNVFVFLRLCAHLGDDQPVYALQPPGFDTDEEPIACVETLAARFVADLRAAQPAGPYTVLGFCWGGLVSFEMARLLREAGETVHLALIGAAYPSYLARGFGEIAGHWMAWHLRNVMRLRPAEWLRYLYYGWLRFWYTRRRVARRARGLQVTAEVQAFPVGDAQAEARMEAAAIASCRSYVPRHMDGPLSLFVWDERLSRWAYTRPLDWLELVGGDGSVVFGPRGCGHGDELKEPYVGYYAEQLSRWMTAQHG
jgi:thioesterase domain-containing protein